MSVSSLRLLLVDNNPNHSDEITARLENAGHQVLPTASLTEAMSALELQRFDAVLFTSHLLSAQLIDFKNTVSKYENEARSSGRIPLLCYGSTSAADLVEDQAVRTCVDGFLPGDFPAVSLSEQVAVLAASASQAMGGTAEADRASLPVINAEDFQEQVGFDREIIVEIIDLFLSDSVEQLRNMREALQREDLNTLSRTAHSIKGSLGSLYAKRATAQANALEHIAKEGDSRLSAEALVKLEAAVAELIPELQKLRNDG